MTQWDDCPRAPVDEVRRDPDSWFRGYFLVSHGRDETAYRRDLDELRRRDLFLFSVGDVTGKHVLDVACGSGLYLTLLALMGARVSGQDISADAIAVAKQTLERFALAGRVEVGDATRLLFDDNSFDAVVSGDFIEHITEEQKRLFFAEVFRVLKPGGVFSIKTPNLTYLRLSLALKRLAAIARFRSPRIWIEHTRGNPDYEHHGLTTYRRLRGALLETLFHQPAFVIQPLSKPGVPRGLQHILPTLPVLWPLFNCHLIVVARKPLGLGYFK